MATTRVKSQLVRTLFTDEELKALRAGTRTELLLPTGAKLHWRPKGVLGYYQASGYASDGSDIAQYKPEAPAS